jgi:outer membrane protein insertion porin family
MVLLLSLLLSQAVQPPTRWPIESLTVEGNSTYSSAEILSTAGLKLGQTAGKEEFEAARQKLMATGFFGSAGYRFQPAASGKGIAATVEVVEIPEVYPIRFERLDASPQELEDCLKRSDPLFREKIPPSVPVLDRYARAIEALLASNGRRVAVIGKLSADKTGQFAVIFSPAAPPPPIAEVRFTGSSVLPASALQLAIAGVAIGTPYTESGFRTLLDSSVRPLYEARGRIRVAFPKVTVEKAEQVEGVALTVEVVEGEVYNLGEVRLAGEGLPEADLRKAAAFRTGEIADFSQIGAALDRIKQRLRRSGHLKPETSVERVIHDEQKKVDLVVHVDQGPRFLLGKLTVQGLDLDGEAEIRRLWAIKPGAPFDAEYPDLFLTTIREDGVFDHLGKTKAETKIDEASRTVEVTLVFGPAEKLPPNPRRRR